jgi:hypothetical protein
MPARDKVYSMVDVAKREYTVCSGRSSFRSSTILALAGLNADS